MYFKPTLIGFENIPHGPCLLVGNHNCIAVFCPEVWIFASEYFKTKSELSVLGHDLVLKLPIVSQLAKKFLYYIPNNHQSALYSLSKGKKILLYPGGAWESSRPTREKNIIDFKKRSGFITLAREAGVPIVPIVSTGAHSGIYIWRRGARIAKWLRLSKKLRLDTFPIGLSFPFLFHIGPFFPFIPLPSKVILEVLPPLTIENEAPQTDEELAQFIVDKMQLTMDKNLANLSNKGQK